MFKMSEHPSELSVDANSLPPLSELCSQVVNAINNVLLDYIGGLIPEGDPFKFEYYPGNPITDNDTHGCAETITFPGLYYAVSGSYGLEYIMTDEQRKKLYANDVGAYDIDIKIIFDEEKVPPFVKDAIVRNSQIKRGYDTTKFYYTLMRKIIRSLNPYLLPNDGWLMDIESMGLLFNADESRIDVLVAPLSMCASLSNFLAHTPDKDHLNWKSDFAIFDSLLLFILCMKIGYFNEEACSNDHARLLKLKKIVFRACVITGVDIIDLTGVDMETTESVLQALKQTVDEVWNITKSVSFQNWLMVRYIWNLDIAQNNGGVYSRVESSNRGGGPSDVCVDRAFESAKSSNLDALTLREMFGYDPKGRINVIEIDEENGRGTEEDRTKDDPPASGQTGAGLGDGGYELGLSGLGLLVAVAAALVSSATR